MGEISKSSGFVESHKSEEALCKAFAKNLWQRKDAGLMLPSLWWHNVNEQPRQKGASEKANAIIGFRLKQMGRRAGVPDYQFIWKDLTGLRIAFLEAKLPGNYPSPSQNEFIQDCRFLKIDVAVFRSVQEGLRYLQDWGVLKQEKFA